MEWVQIVIYSTWSGCKLISIDFNQKVLIPFNQNLIFLRGQLLKDIQPEILALVYAQKRDIR